MPIVVETTPVTPGTEVVLDPSEVATGRTELALNTGAIRVGEQGIDWGDAELEPYQAELAYGQVPVDFRVPNRRIVIPLLLGADGAAGFAGAQRDLQAKVALLQRERGWFKRGTGLYADVVGATLHLPDRYGWLDVETDVVLTLEVLPDFYGDEVVTTPTSETTDPELVFSLAGIEGDYPARCRITVDNGSSAEQLGLLWGIRSRYYDDAATAALAFEAEALTPLDTAAVGSLAGASGGSVVAHANLAPNWTPVVSTEIDGVGHMTHRGTYRVWARCYSTSGDPLAGTPSPSLRLVWDVGDMVLPEENAEWVLPFPVGQFYMADLGQVHLAAAPVGDHRWQGVIQAKGVSGGENVSIDRLVLQPVDDGQGRLVASPSPDPPLSGYEIRDEFSDPDGDLAGASIAITGATNASPIVITANAHGLANGDTVLIGGVGGNTAANGVWQASSVTTNTFRLTGSTGNGAYTSGGTASKAGRALPVGGGAWFGTGVTEDFAVADGNASRDTISEAATGYPRGRWAVAVGSAPFTSVTARVDIELDNPDLTEAFAVTSIYGRFVTDQNYFQIWHYGPFVFAVKEVAGVATYVSGASVGPHALNVWYTLTVQVTESGQFFVWLKSPEGSQQLALSGQDPDLATGGPLASGYVGLYDLSTGPDVFVRRYDNFAAWVPDSDAVLHANQSAELRTDGNYRQDATGTAYGPVATLGDLPRLPPSGPENRTAEIILKASRGDLEALPDSGIDDLTATVTYRPCWLFRPGT